MDQPTSFNALLEKYVFTVATELIDQVSPQEQAQLINLFHSIDSTRPSLASTDPVAPTTGSPFSALEAQWQQALNPVARKAGPSFGRPHARKRLALVERALALNQAQIENTRQVIDRLDALILRAEATLVGQSLRRQLLGRYQHLRAHYVTYLDRLTRFALLKPHLPER